jgi:hypothetical protein
MAAMGRKVPLVAGTSDYKKFACYYFVKKYLGFLAGTDKKVPDPVRDDPRCEALARSALDQLLQVKGEGNSQGKSLLLYQ